MMNDILRELDKVALAALRRGAQHISAGQDIAYEAGRRIGVCEGIQIARQALVDYHSKEDDKERDL